MVTPQSYVGNLETYKEDIKKKASADKKALVNAAEQRRNTFILSLTNTARQDYPSLLDQFCEELQQYHVGHIMLLDAKTVDHHEKRKIEKKQEIVKEALRQIVDIQNHIFTDKKEALEQLRPLLEHIHAGINSFGGSAIQGIGNMFFKRNKEPLHALLERYDMLISRELNNGLEELLKRKK